MDCQSPREAPLRLLPPAVLAAVAVTAGGISGTAAHGSAPCSSGTYAASGYGYVGFQAARRGHGVRAALTALEQNTVARGHVAAWVGVGGRGQGPNGVDEWLQVGLASFPGSPRILYYEVMRPGADVAFSLLEEDVARGDLRRVAVLEIGGRPNWWRVWVSGRPASQPIHLPGSTGRWRPIATAEAWDGGSGVCNHLAFRFEQVEVAAARGGSWTRFRSGARFQDKGYRLSRLDDRPTSAHKARREQATSRGTSFLAASA
jgi:hypothetical protein